MASDDDKYKKNSIEEQDEESGGESGSGGKSGQIEFKDFLGTGERSRDDLLSPDERMRLLAVHRSDHEVRVKKQKEKRAQRQAVKEGKISLQSYRQAMGTGMNDHYKVHFLSYTAQFGSGMIDNEVNSVPNEYNAETNNDKRKEFQLNYDLTYKHELANQPKFIPPKPTPYNR